VLGDRHRMKSKTAVTLTAVPSSNSLNAAGEPAADSPAESSPMRRCRSDHSGSGMAPTTAATATRTRLPDRTPSTSKRNGAHAASPSPASRLSGSSPGPGRTPQTKRRELSLNQNIDKIATAAATPNGSPRSRDNSSSLSHSNNNRASQQPPQQAGRATRTGGGGAPRTRTEQPEETSCRKSSNSSQDSGIGRELRSVAVGAAHRADRSSSRSSSAAAQHHNNSSGGSGSRSRSSNNSNSSSSSQPPAILTLSPEEVEQEEGVSQTRARLEQLWGKDKMVELGIVRVPGTLLADIFHPGDIHTFYEVDAVPVAR
jgi:hypothetical protein